MKKIITFLLVMVALSGCGSGSKVKTVEIHEPQLNEEEIRMTKSLINSYQDTVEKWENQLKEDKKTDNEILINSTQELLDEFKNKLNSLEDKLVVAQNTFYYNDEFRTFDDVAILEEKTDSVLSLDSYVRNFSNFILEDIEFYYEEELIKKGIIATSSVLLTDSEEYARGITVYLSKETLDKMDFEEIISSDEKNLYTEADAVWARGEIVEEGIIENTDWANNEKIPEIFNWYIGGTSDD